MPAERSYEVRMRRGASVNRFGFYTLVMAEHYAEKLKGKIKKFGIPPDGTAAVEIFSHKDGKYETLKTVLKCCLLCGRRLPEKEELEWVFWAIERWGQQWIDDEDIKERFEFCVCPAEEPGRHRGPKWLRNVLKIKVALALKYVSTREHPLEGKHRKDIQEAKSILKLVTDQKDGKPLRDDDGKKVRRLIESADRYMYDLVAPENDDENLSLSDLIDRRDSSSLLPSARRRISKKELLRTAPMTNRVVYGRPVWQRSIIPERVCRRLYDENFNGDPWDDSYADPDFPQASDDDPTIDVPPEYEFDEFALEGEIEAVAAAKPGMSESEIREKLYWELPEFRSVIGIEWYKTCDALLPMPMDETRQRACSGLGSFIKFVLKGNPFARYAYGLTAEDTAQAARQAKSKRRLATSQERGHNRESILGFKTASPNAEFRFRSKMYEDLKKRMNAIGSRIAFLIATRSH